MWQLKSEVTYERVSIEENPEMNLPVVDTVVFVNESIILKLFPNRQKYFMFIRTFVLENYNLMKFYSLGLIMTRQTGKRDKLHIFPKKQ